MRRRVLGGEVDAESKRWFPGKILQQVQKKSRASVPSLSSSSSLSPSQGRGIDAPLFGPRKSAKEIFYRNFKPEWRGIIKKQGHRVKNWKSRFFVISSCMMLYYSSEADYLDPEKFEKPLGYHVLISVSSCQSPGKMSSVEEQEFVLETLENKTFNLRFSPTCGFLQASQKAVNVFETEYLEFVDPQLKQAICLSTIGHIGIALQILQSLAYSGTSGPNPEALYHLGTAYLVDNSFSIAISTLQECLDIQSDHIPALINLATAFYCTEDIDHAKAIFESALGLEPSNIEAANNLALLYAQSGTKSDLELAEFKIKYAITCRPEEPRLYLTYAEILQSVSEIERAIDMLFQGLKDVPSQESSDLNMKIGELFSLTLEKQSEAIEYFQAAISIDPQNLKARILLQEALMARESITDAHKESFSNSMKEGNKGSRTKLVSNILKQTHMQSNMPEECMLQGMLSKKNVHAPGEWQELYCELSPESIHWFPSGAEFVKHIGEQENVTHIHMSEVSSIEKIGSLQFNIKTTEGCTHDFKSESEDETNSWLDAIQCIYTDYINNRGD